MSNKVYLVWIQVLWNDGKPYIDMATMDHNRAIELSKQYEKDGHLSWIEMYELE